MSTDHPTAVSSVAKRVAMIREIHSGAFSSELQSLHEGEHARELHNM
jgi:hypothetical protein